MEYVTRKNYLQKKISTKIRIQPFLTISSSEKSEAVINFSDFEDSSKLEFQIYSIHKNIEPML